MDTVTTIIASYFLGLGFIIAFLKVESGEPTSCISVLAHMIALVTLFTIAGYGYFTLLTDAVNYFK